MAEEKEATDGGSAVSVSTSTPGSPLPVSGTVDQEGNVATPKVSSEWTSGQKQAQEAGSFSKSVDQVSKKVEQGKSTEKASDRLAAENAIPVDVDKDSITKGEKALSAVGYILYFCVLPLVLKRKSKFCDFNGKQGLVLTIFYLAFSFLGMILSILLGVWIQVLIALTYIVFVVIGIVNSVQGKIWRVPGVAVIVDKLDFD